MRAIITTPLGPAGGTDGSGMAELELVARIRAGDGIAAEQFVRRHGGRMLQVARRFMRCEQDAADVVQEAFASAFGAIDTFAAGARLSTWLHRITVNAALMKIRARSRRPETSLEGLPAFDADGAHARPVAEWSRDACERVQTRETRTLVRACIDRLPDSYRTVLLLRDIEELDMAEVAALLNCSIANVKTRSHRARQALRGLLEPWFCEAAGSMP